MVGKENNDQNGDKSGSEFWAQFNKALITGASSGLGKEFAVRLASKGLDLVLIARRKERLERLSKELADKYNVEVSYLSKDLSEDSDVEDIVSYIGEHPEIDFLINNAGFGLKGHLASVDFDRALDMMKVHMWAPVKLMRAVLPRMIEHNRGAIINVSSLGSFLPTRGSAMYASTKSFLRVLTESIAFEVEGTAVRVQALCPGFTHTEFHSNKDLKETKSNIPGFLWMSADKVIDASLAELEKGKKVVVLPGLKNKIFKYLLTSHFLGKTLIKLLQPKD